MTDLLTPMPDASPAGRRSQAHALAHALGSAMPGVGDATFAHLSQALPSILEALMALLETQAEATVEAGNVIAGMPLDAQDAGFEAFQGALASHGIGSLTFQRGTGAHEVQVLLEGLLRPAAELEVIGGLRGHLERRYIQCIQARASVLIPGHLPSHLIQEARGVFQAALAPPDTFSWGTAGWLHYVADLRGLGPLGAHLGLASGEPTAGALDLLRQVLSELSPDQFISVGRGMGTVPRRPLGLSLALQRLIPDLLPQAIDQLLFRGLHWLVLHHPVEDLVRAYPGPLSALIEPLRRGLSRAAREPLVQGFLDELAWQAQNLRQQLDQAQSMDDFLALPVEARAQLLERTLKAHRMEALTELLGYLGEAAVATQAARLAAIQTVQLFLPAAGQRLAPDYVVDSLEGILLPAYRTLLDEVGSRALRESLLELFRVRLLRGQPHRLEQALRSLEAAEGFSGASHLQGVALGWVRRSLETDESLDSALECLFQGERSESLRMCDPYFAYLGDPLYHRAAWRLGRESDRQRRDRLIRVLMGAGDLAEEPILRMLRTGMPWYHARNLLMLLASIGSSRSLQRLPPFLDHEDGRVRITALRALRQCSGGRVPVTHLVARLEDPEEPIRLEAIQILSTLRSSEALRALANLASDRRVPLPSRLAAIQGLGGTRLPEAVAPLSTLAASRGGLLKRGEPDALRLAAAQALRALPQGEAALRSILRDEGKGPLAQALGKA